MIAHVTGNAGKTTLIANLFFQFSYLCCSTCIFYVVIKKLIRKVPNVKEHVLTIYLNTSKPVIFN